MAERDIIFRVGGQEYGFDVRLVTAIEPVSAVIPVPNAPKCIRGLMNLRGEVIPVYSLHRKFGLPDGPMSEGSKQIVTRLGDRVLAFDVDEVTEMIDFEDKELSAPPKITVNEKTAYMRLIGSKNGRLFLLLNPDGMYEGDEEEVMNRVMQELQNKE